MMIAFIRIVEWVLCKKCNRWQFSGRYGIEAPGKPLYLCILILTLLIVPITLIWSFAQRWSFPQLLPTQWSSQFWLYEWDNIFNAIEQSVFIALTSSTISLLFAVIVHEHHTKSAWRIPNYIIAIPMLIPQLSILFGIQIMTLLINTDLYLFWVCWAHVLFAFPYVYLSLDGPWSSFNVKLICVATSLGKSPTYAWWKIKLPHLLPGVAIAWSVGASVSFAQYLPTLMLGSGRVNTITTEAVAIASGADRRVTAIYALWQTFLPLIFFSIAMLINYKFSQKYRMKSKGNSENDAIT
jgi:putative thiamine transport system permease protein